jgi:hypothetical protein
MQGYFANLVLWKVTHGQFHQHISVMYQCNAEWNPIQDWTKILMLIIWIIFYALTCVCCKWRVTTINQICHFLLQILFNLANFPVHCQDFKIKMSMVQNRPGWSFVDPSGLKDIFKLKLLLLFTCILPWDQGICFQLCLYGRFHVALLFRLDARTGPTAQWLVHSFEDSLDWLDYLKPSIHNRQHISFFVS